MRIRTGNVLTRWERSPSVGGLDEELNWGTLARVGSATARAKSTTFVIRVIEINVGMHYLPSFN
jgi:hypothetical protein